MAKKIKIPPIIAIIIIVVIAVVVLMFILKDTPEEETSLEGASIAEEIHGFTAKITEIKDKTLILEGQIPAAGEGFVKATVKAKVADNTKIAKLKFVDETSDPKETPMSFDELKVGDKINIGAMNNISENIKNGTEFELKFIFIFER